MSRSAASIVKTSTYLQKLSVFASVAILAALGAAPLRAAVAVGEVTLTIGQAMTGVSAFR